MALKIGELARQTHCTVETIRYYEQAGLLPAPLRSSGNYRLYNDNHIERLHFIRHCRTLDISLEEIQTLLAYKDTPEQDCAHVNALLDTHIDRLETQIATLLSLKRRLQDLRGQCSGSHPVENCGIIQGLEHCSCETAVSPA
ncbi:Cd(II)/Pb(II)-responsive transcriptional regulator [Alcaligenaceae bacterium SJ-26]|nr:Cd(II)/Pb(II)-responsive transcriptional regulator [Alcaligenaceae bacterium SJ-26]